jgi:hypothetical protein
MRADGRPLGNDYRMAFEVEVDPANTQNMSQYQINYYGYDKTGDGVFDPLDVRDDFRGHVFQSNINVLSEAGRLLNRDIYGFLLIHENTSHTLEQLQQIVLMNMMAQFTVENHVLSAPAATHDSSSQFVVRRVSDRYDINMPTMARSPFEMRNYLLTNVLLGGSTPLLVPILNEDPIYGAGTSYRFHRYQVRFEIVQRPNAQYFIICSLTEDDRSEHSAGDPRTDEARNRLYLERILRLEDLSEGSALARFESAISKRCLENDPARSRADLLWVLDDSASMQQMSRAALRASEEVKNMLSASRDIFDFRIGATTSNRSALVGSGSVTTVLPGGGGLFYWENSGTDQLGQTLPPIPQNGGFFGASDVPCARMSLDLSRHAGPRDVSCGGTDESTDVYCERVLSACQNGLANFSSQVCDLIWSMDGVCGSSGRPYASVEQALRSTMHFINRVAPARHALSADGSSWDPLHLRQWCSDPSNTDACPASCDPRPKANKIITIFPPYEVGCFIDGDCMPGERCLLSYGFPDAGHAGDPNVCHSANGKCCYQLHQCTVPAECAAGQICRAGPGCEGSCCYDDCDMVPLITVLLSDEEDAYFKDDCRNPALTPDTQDGFDFEQLPIRCLFNGAAGCTLQYCTENVWPSGCSGASCQRFTTDWTVNHDAQTEELPGSTGYSTQFAASCGDDAAPHCRGTHYHDYYSYDGDVAPTSYANDCAACKRFLRWTELTEFLKPYGPVYAITRKQGRPGSTTNTCGSGVAAMNRGDGQAYRDIASATGGRVTDVCLYQNVGYQDFLQLIIADAQAALRPYALQGTPIAATIKVGIYGPTRGQMLSDPTVTCEGMSDGWGICLLQRSRFNGFNYDSVRNALTFQATPIDGAGGPLDGRIDQAEIDYARTGPNLPKTGEVVIVSYRFWINLPCNDSCTQTERCIRQDCLPGSTIPTSKPCVAGTCRDGEICDADSDPPQCVVPCGDGLVDYCRQCASNCGLGCGNCETCSLDPGNPGCYVCVPHNDLCVCNPDPMNITTCNPNQSGQCGPGLCCDESCVCQPCPTPGP